ncbi:MAG TPA: hypothetical protein VGH74_11220 [Planctomycetaceae bacterium]|jgi:hypothetical protein
MSGVAMSPKDEKLEQEDPILRKLKDDLVFRKLKETLAIGGLGEEDRWNKPDKLGDEFFKHLIRVGYLYEAIAKTRSNLFARAHAQRAKDKHDKDMKLKDDALKEKFHEELTDLLLYTKEYVCTGAGGKVNEDKVEDVVLKCYISIKRRNEKRIE